MGSQILVTGATGIVGGEVVRQLHARGTPPIALVHSADKAPALESSCAEVRVADLRDEAAVRVAVSGVDRLFMLTPVTPDQVEIGLTLVRLATDAGVQRIVKLSFIGADREPGVLLSRWHREMERAIEDSGVPWTFVRPAGFMQMMAGFYGATIPAQGMFFMPCGGAAVCKVDTRDVAAVATSALLDDGWEGQALTPTGPEALTYHQLAALMAEASERPVTYVDVPEEAARAGLEQMGVPEPMLSGFLELFAMEKAGGAALVTDHVERVTGKPPRSFADFARDYAAAWAPAAAGGPPPA
jgi:uncharacterized protein YbjT (DUF2867 family)